MLHAAAEAGQWNNFVALYDSYFAEQDLCQFTNAANQTVAHCAANVCGSVGSRKLREFHKEAILKAQIQPGK